MRSIKPHTLNLSDIDLDDSYYLLIVIISYESERYCLS